MVIEFSFDSENWKLSNVRTDAQQYDNETVKMIFKGDFPSEFDAYDALISYGNNLDIIPLEPMEGGWGKILTAENLAFSGYYLVQLKAKNGDKAKHTNIYRYYIAHSLSGDEHWPVVPTAFTEAVQEANSAKQGAIDAKESAVSAKNDAERAKNDLLNAVATEEEVREIITDGNGDD